MTIYAPATAPGRAGVAVLRISGPAARAAVEQLAGRLPEPRRASLLTLRDRTGEAIDRALVLWFPGPASYTGEDMAEFHVHGGRAVSAALAEALGAMEGLRPAEPGEFTRRAFANGRIDLTEAEAVADLVAAETAAQRRQALSQLSGSLARLYDGWARRLTRVLAHLEAAIDFPDEDLPGGLDAASRRDAAALVEEMSSHLADGRRGERLRDGIAVAIVGAPNAGKSSLLNALAERDVAIVSARAGTTRDVVEVHLDLKGYPVLLADTAGLRAAADEIEDEGIRRARARAAAADIVLVLVPVDQREAPDPLSLEMVDERAMLVASKADLAPRLTGDTVEIGGVPALAVSAASGAGLGALVDRLAARAAESLGSGGAPVPTRARHRAALEACRAALERALAAPLPELAAEDVRLALRALGRITGRVDVEDLLDVIFRDFCIGK